MKLINTQFKIGLIFFLTFCFFTRFVSASQLVTKGDIRGVILDGHNQQPLEYATISLFKAKSDSLINGTITNKRGFFRLEDIPPGNYNVSISFIGYKSKTINNVIVKKGSVELGEIMLQVESRDIEEVKVTSAQNTVSYKIDRKVLTVNEQDVPATGTAKDVLETYPSVTVNIDGTVSLRGSSSFIVLIDNKPTALEPADALSQIPANIIQSIEIITNPGAKYDSEGVSGIVNVLLKKRSLQGISGIIRANAGMYKNFGGDILFDLRKEKLNFFVGLNLNNRGIEGTLKSTSKNSATDTTRYIQSSGNYYRIKKLASIRGGLNFDINSQNIISLNFNTGSWESGGKTWLDYKLYSQPESEVNNYKSVEKPLRKGPFVNVDIEYTHKFEKEGHHITSIFVYDWRDLTDKTYNELSISNNIVSGDKYIDAGKANSYNFKIDYVLPVLEHHLFEAGFKTDFFDNHKQSELYQYNTDLQYYELSNEYSFDTKFYKNIHALYSLFKGEVNRLGYQVGVRGEYTDRNIKLIETNESNLIERLDFFPTVHFSFEMNKQSQFMLSYSRRIKRPYGWQLEPFYTWTDAYNLRLGNPKLNPEYIDSYEAGFIQKWKQNTLSTDIYYRFTNDNIESIRELYNQDVHLRTFINAGTSSVLGTEVVLSTVMYKWWRAYISGNLFDYRIRGEIGNQSFDKQNFKWNLRFYNYFTLKKFARIQIGMIYNSPGVTLQGENRGYFMTNASIQKVFFEKFTASIQAQGVFGLLERFKTFEMNDFYLENNIVPYTPIVTLSVSYKINNYNNRRRNKTTDLDQGEGSI